MVGMTTRWCFEPSFALGYHDVDTNCTAFYLLDVCGYVETRLEPVTALAEPDRTVACPWASCLRTCHRPRERCPAFIDAQIAGCKTQALQQEERNRIIICNAQVC